MNLSFRIALIPVIRFYVQLQLLGHNLSFPSVTAHLLLLERETEIGWDNKK